MTQAIGNVLQVLTAGNSDGRRIAASPQPTPRYVRDRTRALVAASRRPSFL